MVRMQIRRGVRWPAGVDFGVPVVPHRTTGAPRASGEKGQVMKLTNYGCTNRPFYHIEVTKKTRPKWISIVEQVGVYDPLPNEHGEKLCSLNLELITKYLAKGCAIDNEVAMLLGLAGLLPQSPKTYSRAWRNREEIKYRENLANEVD